MDKVVLSICYARMREIADKYFPDNYFTIFIYLFYQQSLNDSLIRDIWQYNFFEKMGLIYELNSIDNDYYGTVYMPTNTENELEYNMIKADCDNFKLIQVRISMSNVNGDNALG